MSRIILLRTLEPHEGIALLSELGPTKAAHLMPHAALFRMGDIMHLLSSTADTFGLLRNARLSVTDVQ